MAIPYPTDPSLPSNLAPLFGDSTAARGDHLRANNAEIWANFTEIGTMLGNASLSTDETFSALSDLLFPSQKAVAGYVNDLIDSLFPIGTSWEYSGMATNIPSVCMIENGANLARADYGSCFDALSAVIGTVTITIATPGLLTYNLHPFQTGDCIHLTTTGDLPTGLSANTNYYVIVNDGNTFWLATTAAHAAAGTKINTSGTQSGTHTITWIPWGAADGTHFYLPDTQGLSTEGSGVGATAPAYNPWLSSEYSGRLGQYKQDQMQKIEGSIEAALNGIHGLLRSGYNVTGAFKSNGTVSGLAAYDPGTGYKLGFDSSGSLNARTSATTAGKTAGPRVGKWKIIRVM